MNLDRRDFLRRAGLVSGVVIGNSILPRIWANAGPNPGVGPYGPLQAANADGIELPAGFSSRLLAVSGQVVSATAHTWHTAPDGGACFATSGGGWVYVSNSEGAAGGGGVGALKFDSNATLVSAYSILTGTSRNCAGGVTPNGTWLSCEENGSSGKVWECNPLSPGQGVVRPALGSFNHEAAQTDPVTGYVYLTEDDPNGRLYRFVPTVNGDLSSGQLYAAQNNGGTLSWIQTSAASPDRQPTTTAFNGGEGLWIENGILYFTTKNDVKVWKVVLATQSISVFYDAIATPSALNAVDNVTVHYLSGDIFVAEDGGNLELGIIANNNGFDEVAAFLRFVGHNSSEIAGPAFSPDGTRLYVSSQRGTNGVHGRTYEITGPFRTVAGAPSDTFRPVAVRRFLDTRSSSPIATGTSRNLQVTGLEGIPSNATAVALNIAAVNTSTGHLRIFPAGAALPTASVLNFQQGKNTANHVIVKVGTAGQISIYAGSTTDVIVDVNGYFVPDGRSSTFVPVPVRTRLLSATVPGAVAGNPAASSVTIPVHGAGGIGSNAVTAVVNIGAISPTASGHLRVFPAGALLPQASTHNFVAGDSRMNLVLVNPGTSGGITVYNASPGSLTVTVDTVGFFQSGPGLSFQPINPIRPLDTRSAGGAPLASGAHVEVAIRGFGVVPNSNAVQAVVVNVAAVNPTGSGSIDVGPSGVSPALPWFTHPAGENVANLALVPLGADGKIRLVNNSAGSSHVIVDITGYFFQ